MTSMTETFEPWVTLESPVPVVSGSFSLFFYSGEASYNYTAQYEGNPGSERWREASTKKRSSPPLHSSLTQTSEYRDEVRLTLNRSNKLKPCKNNPDLLVEMNHWPMIWWQMFSLCFHTCIYILAVFNSLTRHVLSELHYEYIARWCLKLKVDHCVFLKQLN